MVCWFEQVRFNLSSAGFALQTMQFSWEFERKLVRVLPLEPTMRLLPFKRLPLGKPPNTPDCQQNCQQRLECGVAHANTSQPAHCSLTPGKSVPAQLKPEHEESISSLPSWSSFLHSRQRNQQTDEPQHLRILSENSNEPELVGNRALSGRFTV